MPISLVFMIDELNNTQLCLIWAWRDHNHTVNKVFSNDSGLEYIPIENYYFFQRNVISQHLMVKVPLIYGPSIFCLFSLIVTFHTGVIKGWVIVIFFLLVEHISF